MENENTTEDIRALAKRIDEQQTYDQLFDSFTPEDIKENSVIAAKLLNHANPDPGWVRFAQVLGAYELTAGEMHKQLQQSVDASQQLLMVMTGAQDQMQLLELTLKLKKLEKKIPSMLKQLTMGMAGGQAAAQASQYPIVLPAQQTPATDPSTNPSTATYTSYPWSNAAKATGGPAPQVYGAIFVSANGAQLAATGDKAIGVAVSVDTNAKTVNVAVNGQQITGLPSSFFSGLQLGDELIARPLGGTTRTLITMAEALAQGVTPGVPVKVIARVLTIGSIVITDQAQQPLPSS